MSTDNIQEQGSGSGGITIGPDEAPDVKYGEIDSPEILSVIPWDNESSIGDVGTGAPVYMFDPEGATTEMLYGRLNVMVGVPGGETLILEGALLPLEIFMQKREELVKLLEQADLVSIGTFQFLSETSINTRQPNRGYGNEIATIRAKALQGFTESMYAWPKSEATPTPLIARG